MPAHSKSERKRRRWPYVAGAAAVVAAVVAGAVVFLVASDGDENGPPVDDAAAAYLSAWSAGDTAAMAALVVEPPADFVERHTAVTNGLQVSAGRYELGETEADPEDDDRASAEFTAELDLAGLGTWSYDGSLDLELVEPTEDAPEDSEPAWKVVWSPATIHRDLTADTALARSRERPERAPIVGAGGAVLVGAAEGITVGIVPERMQDREQVKAVLADQLQVDPAEVDAKLDAPGVQPNFYVPIITVPRARYEQVKPVIYPIPGLVFRDQSTRTAALPGLGADLLGTTGEISAEQLTELGPSYQQGDIVGRSGLEAAFEEQLGGQASGTVRIVDAEGEEVEVLHTFAGEAPTPLQTTIDPAVQAVAEATLADVDANAALVAVRPTGEVLAVANKPVGGFNRAIAGIYPPGSTFKVATATALLRNGVTPETVVQCPPTIEVGGRSFRNFEGGASGAESFADAFAESCNTAFIGSAEGLPAGALAEAAETFGFNTDYDLGVTTGDTAFPAPEGDTERAAAAIGQARVTASPVHLATIAGAVRAGSWSPPVLLPQAAPADESLIRAIEPALVQTLRGLMAGVVQRGSGTAAQPAEAGKTGTAEFGSGDPPPTHALFIGYRGDVAVAVVVEGGEAGGRVAAPVAGEFFAGL